MWQCNVDCEFEILQQVSPADDEPDSPGGFEMADDDEGPGCLTLNPGSYHVADEAEDQVCMTLRTACMRVLCVAELQGYVAMCPLVALPMLTPAAVRSQGLDLLSDRDDAHRAMPTSPLEPRHLR